MAKININGICLSYLLQNGEGDKTALIMHGWGANKELMEQFFAKYLKTYCKNMIFLDFAGFGGSDEPKKAYNSNDYLKLTKDFLNTLGFNADILLGHSFGGKIACLMACQNECEKLILCSSAGLKLPKNTKVKIKIFLAKAFKKLNIKNMKKLLASKDGANLSPIMYETFKNVVDEDFTEKISQINTDTLILWGEKDTATPLHIGKKMNKMIKNSIFKVFQGDHFFFIQNDLSNDIDDFLR